MEVHLHFGMHRDIPVIHRELDTLDGLFVPAHILAHQKPSTSAFLTSLPADTAYLVDPVTYRFQNSRDKHLNAAEELRLSTAKLCAEYHEDLAGLVLEHGELTPDLLPTAAELTEGALRFQRTAVEEGSGKSAARKYLERYDRSRLRAPRALVPPYFRFEAPGDSWYRYSLDCAAEAARTVEVDETVMPVVAGPLTAFREAPLIQILQDYRDFDHIALWIDDFHENFARAGQVVVARNAIRRFHDQTQRVETLYGGYLLLLSEHDGLASIGHGILYTQHKSYQISAPGDGGAAERYYIPRLRQFRSLSQTDLILHRFPELICDCPVCQAAMGQDPDRIVNFFDDTDLLRRHFLQVRRNEADLVRQRTLEEEAQDLRQVYARYHDALRVLPNPDAIVSGATMQGLGFLLEWAEGITQN